MKIHESNVKFTSSLTPRSTTDSIVLHHAEASKCSVEDIHRWHLENGWSGIGYHFLVRKDGSIWRGRPEHTKGAHTEGHNDHTLGVCVEGDFTKETMGEPQSQSFYELISCLKDKYQCSVKLHRDFNATTCPGSVSWNWSPEREIAWLRRDGIIDSPHRPSDKFTWGEFATVTNRLRMKGVVW